MSVDAPFEVQPKYGSDDWIDDFGIPREKRFSRPKLPHPETGEVQAWTRTSTIAKVLDDTYNLELWKQRMVAKGVASRRDLTNRAATTDLSERASWIEICDMAMEHAGSSEGRNNGTALHALVETYNADPSRFDPNRYPEEMLADLYAYVDALKAAGITMAPELAERTTVNTKASTAGTWDGVAYCRSWAFPRIGDLKTQKTIDYSQASIAIQVAGYAYGDVMLPKPWPGKDGTKADYLPMPSVDLTKGILIHLPVGKAECHIYEIDIEAGFSALKCALSVRRWRSNRQLFKPLLPSTDYTVTDLRVPTIVPTARHTKPEPTIKPPVDPPVAYPDAGLVTVTLDELAGVAGDDEKMRDHIRGAIRKAGDKGTLAAMFAQYEDYWTPDMTDLGKDRLRELAGKQPEGPPF